MLNEYSKLRAFDVPLPLRPLVAENKHKNPDTFVGILRKINQLFNNLFFEKKQKLNKNVTETKENMGYGIEIWGRPEVSEGGKEKKFDPKSNE